jgi:hypothetical protein
MKSRLLKGLLLTILAGAGIAAGFPREAGAGDGAPPRPWPLDVTINLSSSFAEFRTGHLHAGLDIRTFGREGIPCRAVGSGYVSRLRASSFGYGKAVYLKLETGETVVYAHLAEYPARIDSVVHAAQVRAGSYRVDIHLDPAAIPVQEGEVVGYTGRTGTAAPHLHFEVRNESEHPVNPFDVGWELEDKIPPEIRRVRWYPLTAQSRAAGECSAANVELRRVDGKTFVAKDTVSVVGTLGIAVDVIDRLTTSSGKLAPYRVELDIDERRVASITLRRFSYDHTREVELAYDMGPARALGRHYLFLFKRPGETLWNREFAGSGFVDTDSLSPGVAVHHAVIRAIDKWGHVSTATLPFIVGEAGESGGGTVSEAGELPGCYFFDGLANLGEARNADGPVEWGELPDSGATFRIPDSAYPAEIHLFPVRADEPVDRDFPEIGVGVSTRGGSFYTDTHVYLARWEGDVKRTSYPRDAIVPASRAIRLGPVSLALKSSVEIRFSLGREVADNEAVFHFDERKKEWSFRSSFVHGDTVSSFVREPGVYAVFVDSVAPVISAPRVEMRKSYDTGESSPEIVVPIEDGGSGVDVEKAEIYIDANKQIARWDGFSQKLFVLVRNQNIIGERDLAITAVDRVGNRSNLSTRITIPAIPPAAKATGTGGRTE